MRYGRTFERELPAGRHTVKASNTLFSTTQEFDAAAGETVRYRCENGLTGGGMVMVLMMGVAYLKVKLVRIGDSGTPARPDPGFRLPAPGSLIPDP